MNEQPFIESIEHYTRTGEIQDNLVPFFRQTGRWVGDCRNWSKQTYRMASSIMHQAVLPCERRTTVNARGESILRTSFHWRKRRDVVIPWFEVLGSIKIRSLEGISAPNLRSVGGDLYSCTDSEARLPNLQRVGGDLDLQGCPNPSVPMLTAVGGSLLVIECDLPNLETVGNRFWGFWSNSLNLPKLRSVGGSFKIQGANSVVAPALERVYYDLILSCVTTVFRANRLVEVGGTFDAQAASVFRAAALRYVGDTLNTQSAADYYRPEFEDLALWAAHPDAELRWNMRGAFKRTISELPPIEI